MRISYVYSGERWCRRSLKSRKFAFIACTFYSIVNNCYTWRANVNPSTTTCIMAIPRYRVPREFFAPAISPLFRNFALDKWPHDSHMQRAVFDCIVPARNSCVQPGITLKSAHYVFFLRRVFARYSNEPPVAFRSWKDHIADAAGLKTYLDGTRF